MGESCILNANFIYDIDSLLLYIDFTVMKKLGWLILLSFTGLLSIVSCKKKKVTYTVKGNVYDNTFSQNFSSLTLKVEVKKSGNAYYSFLTNTATDASGNYSFTIENDLYEQVRISSLPNNYFPINRVISYSNLTQEDNVYNLSTTAKSWARLIFNNVNPNASDVLKYTKQAGKVDCSECCPATEQTLTGAINDTIICINDGNTYYSYFYTVLGTSNNGINSVLTVPFDTTTLILNY